MSAKSSEASGSSCGRGSDIGLLQADLERRGIAPDYAQSIAEQLAAIDCDRSARDYEAILEGVDAAVRAQRELAEAGTACADRASEMQRLMEGFARELRKFDEGLRLLSAYVIRMGKVSSRHRAEKVH